MRKKRFPTKKNLIWSEECEIIQYRPFKKKYSSNAFDAYPSIYAVMLLCCRNMAWTFILVFSIKLLSIAFFAFLTLFLFPGLPPPAHREGLQEPGPPPPPAWGVDKGRRRSPASQVVIIYMGKIGIFFKKNQYMERKEKSLKKCSYINAKKIVGLLSIFFVS